MKVRELAELLAKQPQDSEVLFDTEAALYLCHVVPVDAVATLPAEAMEGEPCILSTRSEESRSHHYSDLGDMQAAFINGEKEMRKRIVERIKGFGRYRPGSFEKIMMDTAAKVASETLLHHEDET